MANQRAGILGTGHAYPEGILTNDDLAKIVETSDEWITTRTGIRQRRKAAPGEYTSMFAARAGREAIEHARLDPSDI
ncbi:MAG TPA: 3-oxoacyl-ACP synthase, partial [Pyrinomonadaceae bacterium]